MLYINMPYVKDDSYDCIIPPYLTGEPTTTTATTTITAGKYIATYLIQYNIFRPVQAIFLTGP